MDEEIPVVFDCSGRQLVGILHPGAHDARLGVVIVVGGPQYRVGSHRQFVIMARHLAAGGIPVIRFDYRGMGDSFGEKRTFEEVDEDIHAAIDCITDNLPNLTRVALLGLCDAASAILMYGAKDERVSGLILLNPWVRTGVGSGRFQLRHYYFPRLLQRSFWLKVFSGTIAPIKSVSGLMRTFRALGAPRDQKVDEHTESGAQFVGRMLVGLQRFQGPILLLVSERDLATREFLELCKSDRRWSDAIEESLVLIRRFTDADHTMSARRDLNLAGNECLKWIAHLALP